MPSGWAGAVLVLLLVIGVLQWLSSSPPVPKRAVGEVFRDALKGGGEGLEMVVLPTGSFRTLESTVTIGSRIAMSRYKVTFADYDRFVLATGRASPDKPVSPWGEEFLPVEVSYWDAKLYATWLSTQTGKTYRLPNAAEWRYAAQAGLGPGRPERSFFGPNAFGLFGMNKTSVPNLLSLLNPEWVDCHGDYRTFMDGRTCVFSVRWPSARAPGFRLVQDLNP